MARNKRTIENRKLLAAVLAISLVGLFGCGRLPDILGAQTQTPAVKQSLPEMQINKDGTLTLNLDVPQGKSAMKLPVDMPQGPVTVHLPLFPSAQVTQQTFPLGATGGPASAYVKEASAEFVLPVAETVAQTWYQDQMPKIGYAKFGTGRADDTHKGLHTEYYEFDPPKNSLPVVRISFHQLTPNQTLILYYAYAVVQPPRPTASLLPSDMVKLDMTYNPGRTAQPQNTPPSTPQTIEKTITAPTTLKRLVDEINAMPLDTASVKHCVMDTGQGATLHFVTANGKTYDVLLHEACSDVSINNGRALVDVNSHLWCDVTELSK